MRLGADDYITKPFTRKELLDSINTRIGKHEVAEKLIGDKLESLYNNIFHALPKEFNTPLSDIMSLVDTLEQAPLEYEQVGEIAAKIATATRDVSGLIQRFLLSTELEINRLKPHSAKVQHDQTSTAKEIITETAMQIAQDAKRVKDLEISVQEAVIKISPVSLKILVEELIKHTFRYSTLQTPIRISSLTKNATYIIYVSATSQEVDFEYLSMPNAYSHLQNNYDQLMAGGLGLTIARQIAEISGGELTTEVMHGRRTMVKVVLPM
jgi:K+-sensing histidine kinase KdpD